MNRKGTLLWRLAVLALFASLVPTGVYILKTHNSVDTEKMLDVSVSIRTVSHVTIDKFGDSVWESSTGSGFMISSRDCEVWTNQHVIADAAVIEVFPRGWNQAAGIPARVVNSTPRSDIAILQLESCDDIPQALLGDSSLVQAGDETFAVGNPLGRNPDSISRGIISHTARYRDGPTPYLQTDAAINPGNSGGALFDSGGRVIGINTGIDSSRMGTNVGIGYAVPINLAKQVVAELREGPPSWGDAGFADIVSILTADEAAVFNVPDEHGALVVTKTPEEGPSAGKLLAHDVIYRVNDTGVTNTAEVVRSIGQHRVGDILTLDLIRSGQPESIEITLGEGWKADETQGPDEYEGLLGMTLEMWNQENDDRGRFKKPVITKVHSLGPAHKAHIASSQKTLYMQGPVVVPYILDVKTVTGVAYQGEFHEVATVEEIEEIAAQAYASGEPLLLEIEYWARANPTQPRTELELTSTVFYKLSPERSEALVEIPESLQPIPASTSHRPLHLARTPAAYRHHM
jgi:S1-C subfamily serine protease